MITGRWMVLVAVVASACKRDDSPALAPEPPPTPPAPPPAVVLVDAATQLVPIEITAGKPVLVATTGEQWADGFPLGEPLFALYDNGALLCADETGRHAVMLTPAEREEMIRAFVMWRLVRLAGSYQTIEATDQRTSDLYIWTPDCRAHIDVWGEMLTADHGFTADVQTSTIPAVIAFTWRRIQAYPCSTAAPWRFPKVEAILYPTNDRRTSRSRTPGARRSRADARTFEPSSLRRRSVTLVGAAQ